METRAACRVGACLAGVLGGVVWLAACDISVREGNVSVTAFSGRATEEWTRRYPLTADGLVEIVNINGAVDVVTGQDGVVEVHVTRTARALTDEAARERLRGLTIEESVSGGRVRLETRVSAPADRASQEVHYQISTPRASQVDVLTTNGAVSVTGVQGRVKASSTNGSITGEALAGGVEAATVNGAVRVDLAGVGPAGVRLESVNGALHLRVPDEIRANLSARCVNGRIDVTGLRVPRTGDRHARQFDTQLNGGGPSIELRTTNGAISIDGKT